MKMSQKILATLIGATLFLSGCNVYTGSGSGGKSAQDLVKPDYKKAYEDYLNLGAEYMQRGEYDLAEPKLKRAIEIDSRPPEAWNMLAVLYEETRDIAQGNQVYQKLINSHPDYALGFSNYASFLCKFNRDSEFNSLLQQMRAKGTEFSTLSYIAEGNCDMTRNNTVGAESAYRQAVAQDPHAAGALLPLADIALQQQNYQAAINYIRVIHTYVGYSPESVRIGILAARGSGNATMEADLMRIMRSQYKNSPQAQSLGI